MEAALSPSRRVAERLLGREALAYVLHLRPMEWPIMAAHFLLGTFLAAGLRVPVARVAAGLLLFVVLLNGGTLAINSAFDKDEGDIGYLKNPPRPPRHLFEVSLAMLIASAGLGFLLPPAFAWSTALCAVLSILYSVPPIRLKARAGWDLLINAAGFGLLTPLAGWGLSGRPVTPAFWKVIVGFALLFGALYPLTQIYQIEEDRGRGDRTLVIQLGEALSLWGALGLAVAAHLWFAWGALQAGRGPLPLLLSMGAWTGVLLPWCLQWRRWTPRQSEAGMYRALVAWAVTDVSLLLLLWPR